MRQFRIGTRLTVGVTVLVLFVAATGGLGLRAMGEMDERTDNITKELWVRARVAQALADAAMEMSRGGDEILLARDAGGVGKAVERFEKNRRAADEALSRLDGLVTEGTGRKGAAEARGLAQSSEPRFRNVERLVRSGEREAAQTAMEKDLDPILDRLEAVCDELTAGAARELEAAAKAQDDAYHESRTTVLVVVVVAVLIAVAFSIPLVRSITGPLVELVGLADNLDEDNPLVFMRP